VVRRHAVPTRSVARPLPDAVEALGGAAIVLDADLRVVASTRSAIAMLGFEPTVGESAARVLCGDAPSRPFAEALAAGRPVQAMIAHPGSAEAARRLGVRSVPLGPRKARTGWVLLLDEASFAETDEALLFEGMWTRDAGMKEVFRVVERVADDDVTVLVRGDTGTGKELVAHAIHALSPRSAGPFRAINCAALPPTLLESELFGHARGAFTGAVRDQAGHFQLAHKGTLFLDEVAELPLELQAKLLRVLETGSVLPVGAREFVKVDVRIVSATHRALRKEVEANRFRADLMYRLRVIPVFLPPLRARQGDVALLAGKFIEQHNARSRRRIEKISPAALEALSSYDFPGNIRELRNALLYAYTIGTGPVLLPSDLPPEIRGTLDPGVTPSLSPSPEPRAESPAVPSPSPSPSPSPEASRILRVLERAGGSRERAAKVLGWSRVTLWRRMREHGLRVPPPAKR
jgi:transcriptional regulator with PAS, ATPase and Fis domain